MKNSAGILTLFFGGLLAVGIAVALGGANAGLPGSDLLRDPTATMSAHPLLGALSSLGILAWWTGAAIALITAAILRATDRLGELSRFLACAGVLTAVLALDDLFLFHEDLADRLFGVSQRAMLIAYAAIAAVFLGRFRHTILRADCTLALLAVLLFGGSLAVDFVQARWDSPWRILVEDGCKLLGIACWSGWLIQQCLGALLGETAPETASAAALDKRLFDLAIALPALVVLAPVLGAIALVVAVKLGRPVLFCQQRPGLHGRPFRIVKFRTMTDARDAAGRLLSDRERMTTFGRFLRSTSLDELPELWNVVRGDMSLVGPRPLLMEYLPRYSPQQARRHEVLPGLTGWAQINGRNAASWPQKFALDVWYIDNRSVWLDCRILAVTVWKVIRREGISQPGRVTADCFHGEQPEGEPS